jgi:hypothetical protein
MPALPTYFAMIFRLGKCIYFEDHKPITFLSVSVKYATKPILPGISFFGLQRIKISTSSRIIASKAREL